MNFLLRRSPRSPSISARFLCIRGGTMIQVRLLAALAVLGCPPAATHGHAEAINVGPFTPAITLYTVKFLPKVEVLADASTAAAGARLKLDARASVEAATLPGKLKEVAAKHLPYNVPVGPCVVVVGELQSIAFQVIGNTGDLKATVSTWSNNCPVWGKVTINARFVPSAVNGRLIAKITYIKADVPTSWRVAGWSFGKQPDKLIEEEISRQVAQWSLAVPAISGGRGTFTGGSIDLKDNAYILRAIADVQIDRATITDFLMKSSHVKQLSITYPPAKP